MRCILLCVTLLLALASAAYLPRRSRTTDPEDAATLDEAWELFKVKFNREYPNEEEENFRKQLFADNLEFIREHNLKYAAGEVSYSVGINHFSDWTREEFNATLNHHLADYNPEGLLG